MKELLIFPLSAFLALSCITSFAQADTLCIKSTLSKKGKIRTITQTALGTAKCKKGYVPLFSAPQLGSGSSGSEPAVVQGATGATGATGPQGPTGSQGVSGADAIVIATQVSSAVDSTDTKEATAVCPSGTEVIGGYGGAYDGLGVPYLGRVAISFSAPVTFSTTSFEVRAYETTATSDSWFVIAFAQCRPN